MEEGQKSPIDPGRVASPRKLVKRPVTWEVSDSESEDEPRSESREPQEDRVVLGKVELPSEAEEEADGPVLPVDTTTSTLAVTATRGSTPSPVKRARKKKTADELEAKKLVMEEKKREREARKEEKEKKKELERLEKEKRKKAASALKLLRPEECGKCMVVQVDAGLLEDTGSEDVLEILASSGYKYSIEPRLVPRSFSWRRAMPADWTCVEGLELSVGEEDQILVLVQPKDFEMSVRSFVQSSTCSTTRGQSVEASASLFGVSETCRDKKTTLVVLGFQDYRWCHNFSRRMERHSLGQRTERDADKSAVTRKQINEVLVFLQLCLHTEVLFLDTWKELGQHVCAVTKSLAQRPFRTHWDHQTFSFCTSAGTWKGWGPRGAVSGLPLSWKRQIQQLNRVSPAMAAAVTEAYPSPQLLVKAYEKCGTEREKIALLSNLRVPQERNTGAGDERNQASGKERRLGPDLSRRIWLLMTSPNPDLVLDLNS
uniref:Essential meiotic structure-specific endonuclease subunit 2 n=1 Tax=Leptobrachium leishanense TaxID=445787 RepID=A0A8C5R016_9ANUR